MRQVYRFHVDIERDRDIKERLDTISRPLRGEFIRDAIRFYVKNTQGIGRLPFIDDQRKDDSLLDLEKVLK